MTRYLQWLMVVLLAANLAACGTKGSLKTPTQMEHDAQKKAKKEADKKKKEEAEKAAKEEADKKEATPPSPEDK